MDTQNTPIHVNLWHRGFWLLAIADLLVSISVYMMLPILPAWLLGHGMSALFVAGAMGVFGIGVFLLGPFCSYWVQHYRRNHVCVMALLGMLLAYLGFYALLQPSVMQLVGKENADNLFILLRLLLGALFGLSQMVLCSTLIIDCCESFQRTEANYAVAWFNRFALSLGPLVAVVSYRYLSADMMFLLMAALTLAGILLIQLVDFPFRAPDDNQHIVSLDRFILLDSWPLFLNLVLITVIIGMLFSVTHSMVFYGMLMVGFFLALLAEKFVFADADLKSEVISGLILIGAALLVMRSMHIAHAPVSEFVPPVLFGLGIGIIGSRFLLFFIKLSRHCQRGTSQSSFMLAWELGIGIGLFLGFALFDNSVSGLNALYQVGVVLAIANLLLYNFVTHSWYINHKNR